MSERFLLSVTIQCTGSKVESPFDQHDFIEDLEIWTDKSKVASEQFQNVQRDLEFVSLVDPSHTPLWAIVDKPYRVYTSNQKSLSFFERLSNYSIMKGNLIQNAVLAKISKESFILFYVENQSDSFVVNCLVLEMSFAKLKRLVANLEKTPSEICFIDQHTEKKDDLIDTLLKQKSINFSNLNSKRQAELAVRQQQLQKSQVRQEFKRIITRTVKTRMTIKPKPVQSEVAEICFKAMCHKFKDALVADNKLLDELQIWLNLLLDVLGE